MACKYCFYLEKEAFFRETAIHRMTLAVLETLVRQVMTEGGGNVAFGWQGGEPTLMGVEFFQHAVEFEKRYGSGGQMVGNGLQTNGLLINDAWCRFLREAQFLIGLSLDGPEHVHDHYRLAAGGGPTWQRVVSAAKRLLDHGVEVNALTVINDYSARFPREIYASHKENDLRHMQFIPCLERDEAGRPAPFSVSPKRFGEFLCQVFDCWLEDFSGGVPGTSVRWFESVFATYVGVPPPECTLLAECGTYVVVEHNGDVFSCDFFVEDQWRLGNVLDGNLAAMLNSGRQARFGRVKAALPHACQVCPWLVHCRGGCPKERWGNSADEKLSYLCEGYKMFFEHADPELRRIAVGWREKYASQSESAPTVRSQAPTPGDSGRNDPCPCGSGKKFKRCCGAAGHSAHDTRPPQR